MHKFVPVIASVFLSLTAVAEPLVVGYERLLEKDGQPTATHGRVLMKALNCMQCHGVGERLPTQTPAVSSSTPTNTATDLALGKQLYHQIGCVACHSPQQEAKRSVHSDPDDPFADLDTPTVEVVPTQIPNVPLTSQPFTNTAHANEFALTKEEKNALAAYLASLTLPESTNSTPEFAPLETPATLKDHTAGCLANTPQPGVPWYGLNDNQRTAIQLALAEPQAPDTATAILETMAELNCFACHERYGYGGIEEGRRPYFTETFDAELGDEGRIPPSLTGVGAKLTLQGLRDVLVHGKRYRPYMATRMPQYDPDRMETLATQLKATDTLQGDFEMDVTGLLHHHRNRYGRQLMGTDGMSCITCHTLKGEKSLGIPAIDLMYTTERLEPAWFMAYMLNPASLRPGTRMPAFFEGDKSTFPKLFKGNSRQQIEALWIYLRELDQTRLPEGMEDKTDYILKPKDRPIILRTFMKDISTHAIAVGYPGGYNIAFDAREARLAIAWKGAFIDAESTWSNRFSPFVEPLGTDVKVIKGNSHGFDEAVEERAKYQFKGYKVMEHGDPIFLYTITVDGQTVPVEEHITFKNGGTLTHFLYYPEGLPWSTIPQASRKPYSIEYQHLW